MRVRKTLGGLLGAAAALTLFSATAPAQGVDCGRLRAEIAGFRGDSGQSQRYLIAAQRQQRELDRTLAYAQQLGCENRRFLFFGSSPPPQCNQINPRIERMQANLARLQQQAAAASGEGQRRALQARYDSYCAGGAQAAFSGTRSFFEQLFGGGSSAPPADVPVGPAPGAPPPGPSVGGGAKAVCVRTCDGGFFPVSNTASKAQYSELQHQCDALCPNVQTELFTYPVSGVIDQAVSADGKPYSSLPNAGLFRSRYDAACTCKPPHETWAQALAAAEELSGGHKSDIVVTQEKSDQMARATGGKEAPAGGKGRKSRSKHSDASSANSQAADEATAVDMANSATGPTVGQESADIGAGARVKGKSYTEKDGHVVDETGPDGLKRRVRIIGPQP